MNDQHEAPEYVQDERDRVEAAAVVRAAFPANLKRWGASRYGINRARNGSTDNPIYRTRSWLRAGARVGMTRVQAQLLVTDLQAVIEREWPVEKISFSDASITEQDHDGAEDCAQMRALSNPSFLPEYIATAKMHVASELVTIAIAEREVVQQRVHRA